LTLIPSNVAITLFFTYPAASILIGRFFFTRCTNLFTLFASIIIFVGCALTVNIKLIGANYPIYGLILAVAASTIYAVYLNVVSRHLLRFSARIGALLIYFGLAVGFLVVVSFFGLTYPASLRDWLFLGIIVVFGSALPTIAFAYSMPRLGPGAYGVLASFELLTVVLIGVVFLGEPFTAIQYLGTAFIIVGIMLSRYKSSPSREEAELM
jgi:drug/metabolite transporter (DMT)-like permease